ncbi:LptE family protein [Porphyromonas sp. COT-108 OH1349]|uniref:LptE family protein n=1 Tax=Porphyromonas sp. COT-108 OH1349 TaxID=1537504 RepID=UPI0009DE6FC9|nr:LptE family protein [Porphyromonas sp. COT-108 OH1349]
MKQIAEKRIVFSLFILLISVASFAVSSCIPSYKLSGTSIDYTKIKSISIKDFGNLAPTVYPPLATRFSEELRDQFQKRTRLTQNKDRGDLELEGEIVGYDLTAEAIQENAYAAKTRLTMRVKVRYVNNKEEKKSFEKEFTAYASFDSGLMFNDVQDALVDDISKDIINQIFNATVEDW